MSQRTALANQMRGMLFEYGLVVAQGIGTLLRRVPELVEEATTGCRWRCAGLLVTEREELVHLNERVKRFDAQLDAFAREDAACRRLQTIPGVGRRWPVRWWPRRVMPRRSAVGASSPAWLG